MTLYNLTYSLSSYPCGVLADKYGRKTVMVLGAVALMLSDLCMYSASGLPTFFVGVLIWGIQLGIVHNMFVSLVTDYVHEDVRGTAIGTYYLIAAAGSFIAGAGVSGYYAWKHRSPSCRQLDGMIILAHIRNQFALSRETYGSPRMHVEMNEEGIQAGRQHAARLMREDGLKTGRRRVSSARHTAIMVSLSLPIFWIRNGVSTSVTYGLQKAGCMWQALSIFIFVVSSAGKREIE